MNTIFIGGSRHVSRLPLEVKKRLDNVIASGHQVVLGDANGADKAVQKHFLDSHYNNVTIFCSGKSPRNNLGSWPIRQINPPKSAKGFQFYAAKDREMASEADFGLMIWDGKSPGTVLNVLRLVQAGKISVLFNVPDKAALNIKSADQWQDFLNHCTPTLLADITERATPEERVGVVGEDQPELPSLLDKRSTDPLKPQEPEDTITMLNQLLASGDASKIMETLTSIVPGSRIGPAAQDGDLFKGYLQSSQDTGMSSELDTFIKLLASMGFRLEAKKLVSTGPVLTNKHR
jgi:hypothetical protein